MSDPTTSTKESLMKELWKAGSSTPPRTTLLNTDGEEEAADEAVQTRISLVESRLLELVEQLHDDDINEDSPTKDKNKEPSKFQLPIHQPHAYPCAETYNSLPAPVSKWPQAPLMLRPTPGSNMVVRGIRYASSTEYQSFPGTCAGCILPVNTGRELPGKSLVIDFESPLFCGTLLMRVAGARSVDVVCESCEDDRPNYFDGKKRKFQVVIKGRFRAPNIPMSECVTGQVFDRPAGKLPARFLVNAFIKFISTLAPQLEAEYDGERPRFLTPLVATAHTVMARDHHTTTVPNADSHDKDERKVNFSIYAGSETMEEEVEEPPSDSPSSIMSTVHAEQACTASSLDKRRGARKKAFNKVAAEQAPEPVFDTDKEYTFEFFQHLLLLTEPEDFNIDMGRVRVGMARSLDGQPIKIMAARKTENKDDLLSKVLWSFDLWHQALYPYAKAALEKD